MEKSFLHVEGQDDMHALIHLLIKNGIDYNSKPWPEWFPEFKDIGSVEKVLSGIEVSVKTATNRSIGFVVDANSDIQKRWQSIREKLTSVDVHAPKELPVEGFVGKSADYRARVGVWVMPDNKSEGALETFLESLIAENNRLIEHARSSTQRAKDLGAEFGDADFEKAVVRAWLAWQESPGHPYGRAIQRKYFYHESAVADQFVVWFKDLFSVSV